MAKKFKCPHCWVVVTGKPVKGGLCAPCANRHNNVLAGALGLGPMERLFKRIETLAPKGQK